MITRKDGKGGYSNNPERATAMARRPARSWSLGDVLITLFAILIAIGGPVILLILLAEPVSPFLVD